MMDGRVKTLHPKVHGGLLAIRDNDDHAAAMRAHGIRPIDLLVVNLYPFEATVASGADFDDVHREHRHRRPGHDPRRGQEPRRRRRGGRAERLRRRAGRARRNMAARPRWRCAAGSPPRPMPAPATYDAAISNWFANELGDPAPAYRAFGGQSHRAAALRREPASGGGVLSHARAAPRRRHRAAGAGQAALLQQHQRHRRGLRMRRRVRSRPHRRLRHRQARQSVRRRRGREPARGLPQGAGLRPGVGVRRHRGAEPARSTPKRRAPSPRSSPRSSSRRTRARKRSPSSAPRRICACWSPAACPIRAQRADREVGRRRPAGAVARQCRRRRHDAQGRDQARADQRRARRSAVCLPRRQAREVEHHRLCQGPRHRRHRRRPDEPHRFRAHRRAQGRGRGEGRRPERAAHQGLGGRLRRVLSRSPTDCWSRSKPAPPP